MDKQQAADWLKSHAPELKCAACGKNSFGVDSPLAMTNQMDDGGHINYLAGYPLVVVVCQNCAHVMFFAAKQMGIA